MKFRQMYLLSVTQKCLVTKHTIQNIIPFYTYNECDAIGNKTACMMQLIEVNASYKFHRLWHDVPYNSFHNAINWCEYVFTNVMECDTIGHFTLYNAIKWGECVLWM